MSWAKICLGGMIATSAAFAAPSFNGFYVGTSADVIRPVYEITGGVTGNNPVTQDKQVKLMQHGKTILAGWGQSAGGTSGSGGVQSGGYYLGLDGGVSFISKDSKDISDNGNDAFVLRFQFSRVFQLALRLGRLIGQSNMMYMCLGAEYARYHFKTSSEHDLSKQSVKYIPRVGYERIVNDKVNIRTDFGVKIVKSFEFKGDQNQGDTVNLTFRESARLKKNPSWVTRIGLTYKFKPKPGGFSLPIPEVPPVSMPVPDFAPPASK